MNFLDSVFLLMIKIDQSLIGFAEKFIVHPFQKLSGKGHIFLARASVCLSFALYLTHSLVTYDFSGIALILCAMLWVSKIFERGLEKSEQDRTEKGYANPYKQDLHMTLARILLYSMSVMVLPVLISGHLHYISMMAHLLLVMSTVFRACDSLPGGTSKISEFKKAVRQFFRKPSLQPSRALRNIEVLFNLNKKRNIIPLCS